MSFVVLPEKLAEKGVSENRPEINAIYHVSCCADEEGNYYVPCHASEAPERVENVLCLLS